MVPFRIAQAEITWWPHLERKVGFTLYVALNVTPVGIVLSFISWLLLPGSIGSTGGMICIFLICYILSLVALWRLICFFGKGKPGWCRNRASYTKAEIADDIDALKANYFGFAERHGMRYFSMKAVFPASLHPSLRPHAPDDFVQGKPIIFCLIPHGVIPLALMAHPMYWWFNNRICRWTAASVVFKLPVIGTVVKSGGYIEAKAKAIEETLSKKDQNVGVVLDGIAGMFNDSDDSNPIERGHVMSRKAIVKIALRTGATIVPVYQFGGALNAQSDESKQPNLFFSFFFLPRKLVGKP